MCDGACPVSQSPSLALAREVRAVSQQCRSVYDSSFCVPWVLCAMHDIALQLQTAYAVRYYEYNAGDAHIHTRSHRSDRIGWG